MFAYVCISTLGWKTTSQSHKVLKMAHMMRKNMVFTDFHNKLILMIWVCILRVTGLKAIELAPCVGRDTWYGWHAIYIVHQLVDCIKLDWMVHGLLCEILGITVKRDKHRLTHITPKLTRNGLLKVSPVVVFVVVFTQPFNLQFLGIRILRKLFMGCYCVYHVMIFNDADTSFVMACHNVCRWNRRAGGTRPFLKLSCRTFENW